MASEHQAISQHQVEQEETTIDLAELFYRLLDKAKFIIVAALLGAIIAFCATKFFMTPMYQASAKLYVLNSSGTSLNLSQIQLSSSLASDYVQVFDNWHVHEMVKRRLNLDYTYAQMGNDFRGKPDQHANFEGDGTERRSAGSCGHGADVCAGGARVYRRKDGHGYAHHL